MRFLTIGVVGALTLAACTSGSDAEPATTPPVAATSPTTAASPTSPATEPTPPTTTAPTTTAAPTPPTTSPISVLEPSTTSLPSDTEALFADAFASYQKAWTALRLAYTDPANEDLRAAFASRFTGDVLDRYITNLDQQAAANAVVVQRNGQPNSLTPVEIVSTVEDHTFVQFLVCETISDMSVDATTSEVLFDRIDSFLSRVSMELRDGTWVVVNETVDEQFSGQETCERIP